MDSIINLGIPHIGELIFENVNTPTLIKCLLVSETWKILARKVFIKRIKRLNRKTFEALFWQARKNGRKDVVQLLINTDQNLNLRDAFMQLCFEGSNDIVQLLLDHLGPNIDLNAKNNGWTALMRACIHGRNDEVKLLLDHFKRIELNATNYYGFTAFMLACSNGHNDIVKLLLDHSTQKINLNARNKDGATAFMFACSGGHKNVVQLILDHSKRFELNTRRNDGTTAFMLACSTGSRDVVKLLLEYSKLVDIIISDNHLRISKDIKNLIELHSMRVQK